MLLQEPCCKLALLWLKLRILDYLPVHGNPRYYQCLLDEDMVRRIKAICTKLHSHIFTEKFATLLCDGELAVGQTRSTHVTNQWK